MTPENAMTKGKTAVEFDEDARVEELTTAIARTRNEMSQTLEKLHGRLNPRVLKEEALEQFRDAKETIKTELQEDVEKAKEAVREHLVEAKESVKEALKAEYEETKASLKAEYTETKQELFTGLKEGVSDAKVAVRDATIGKVETMVHSTQETVKTASRSLLSTVKENPIPTAMVGMGLVWLITSARSKPRSNGHAFGQSTVGRVAHAVGDAGGTLKHKALELAHDTGDVATDLAHGAQRLTKQATSAIASATHTATDALSDVAHTGTDAIGAIASSAKHSVEDAAHVVSDVAQAAAGHVSHFAGDAADQGRRLGHRAEDTFMSNPLAVGAVVVAAGVAVGLAIPMSKIEDKLMGEVRDGVLHKAEAYAGEALDGLDQTAKKLSAVAKAVTGAGEEDEAEEDDEEDDQPARPTKARQQKQDRA